MEQIESIAQHVTCDMDYNPRHAQTYFLQSIRALLTIMTQFDNPYAPSSTTAPMNYDERAELADRSTRFVGALIDGLIMLPIVVPIAFGVGAIIGTVMGEGAATSIIANLVPHLHLSCRRTYLPPDNRRILQSSKSHASWRSSRLADLISRIEKRDPPARPFHGAPGGISCPRSPQESSQARGPASE